MRRILWTVSLGALGLLLAAPSARAVGLGIYGGLGGGAAHWEADADWNDWDFDSDTSHASVGFVFDTAVARNTVFNYRLNLGYDRYEDDIDESGGETTFDGIVVDNTFGFGVLRTPKLRLWVGPQIRLAGYWGNPDEEEDFDITLGGIGVGPVVGLNLHVAQDLTLALDAGFRWMVYGGTGEWDGDSDDDIDYTVTEGTAFVNASLLFRIGDTF